MVAHGLQVRGSAGAGHLAVHVGGLRCTAGKGIHVLLAPQVLAIQLPRKAALERDLPSQHGQQLGAFFAVWASRRPVIFGGSP